MRSFRAVFLQGGSLVLRHRAGSLHRFPQVRMNSSGGGGVVVSGAPAPPVRHLWEDSGSQFLSPVAVWMLWEPGFPPRVETGQHQWILWKSSTCPHVLGFCPPHTAHLSAGCLGKLLHFCFLVTTNRNYKAEASAVDKNKQSKSLPSKNGLDMILV